MSLTQAELQQLAWRKARRSMANGDCVEVAVTDGQIFVRDSKNPAGAVLEYLPGTWNSFLAGVQQGRFGLSS
jgi:predicted secreted Zn-dependent protease